MIRVSVQLQRDGFALDVDFRAGEPITGVFGPSGAGKTTLIHAIAGLVRPDRGAIEVAGRTVFDAAAGIDVPPHRRRIGVVFQEHRLFPHLPVRGNLLYGAPRPCDKLQHIAELLELQPLLGRRVQDLSGGERQRVALGRALLSEPGVLLLDEPLASLDLRLRRQILPYLRRVRDEVGVPMLHVSHDLTEILQVTDCVLVLEGGRAVGHGRYADLVHDDKVLDVVHDRGMSNILAAVIHENLDDEGVSIVELCRSDAGPPCRLVAPLSRAPAGSRVMVSVRPWDVALAAAPVQQVSIRNQIPGRVTRSTMHDRRMLVEVDLGAPLIVEISRRSAEFLKVEPDRPIVCLIKSNAIQYVGEAGSK